MLEQCPVCGILADLTNYCPSCGYDVQAEKERDRIL